MKFKQGERIKCIKDYFSIPKGSAGTVWGCQSDDDKEYVKVHWDKVLKPKEAKILKGLYAQVRRRNFEVNLQDTVAEGLTDTIPEDFIDFAKNRPITRFKFISK